MTATVLVHALRVKRGASSSMRYSMETDGWLLRIDHLRRKPALLACRHVAWDRSAGAWWSDRDHVDAATVALELSLSPARVLYCHPCAQGRACSAWDVDSIEDLGYNPDPVPTADSPPPLIDFEAFYTWAEARVRAGIRARSSPGTGADVVMAARTLGVPWPGCTRDQLQKSFKEAALKAHPDRGGDDATMRRVITARETLERAMGDIK